MNPRPIAYHLDSAAAGDGVLRALSRRFRTAPIARLVRNQVYYDTFDGRLSRRGGVLTAENTGTAWSLAWRDETGGLRQRVEVPDPPGFVWDLPPGLLRDSLEPLVRMRRLLPLASVESDEKGIRVEDSRGKTVLRAVVERSGASEPGADGPTQALPIRLRLLPVRGFGEEMERTARFLEDELTLQRESGDELSAVLKILGKERGGYSSKLRLTLRPWMRADQAAREIHRTLLEAIRANEAGTRQALDSEFLHDFRVAVRRTRSALGQIPGVFPPEKVDHFRREFAWLGSATGPVRDLDVQVLQLQDHRGSLPARAQPPLKPLERFVRGRLTQERERLAEHLESRRYRDLVADWDRFLQKDPPVQTSLPNAGLPVKEVATERLRRAFDSVLKRGGQIHAVATEDELHRLRILCKKLRYLLEFFQSLYEPAAVEAFVKRLKSLQDNLGDYNDYRVQRQAFRDWAQTMEAEGTGGARTFLLMGGLVERTVQLQDRERRRFGARFARFADGKSQQEFRQMLEAPGPDPRATAEGA